MPWSCPACQTQIKHESDPGSIPRAGVIYRCHICRLELVLNPKTNKLVLAPVDDRERP